MSFTLESPRPIAVETLTRRAIEAVIWGMPAVNFDLMYQAAPAAKRRWGR